MQRNPFRIRTSEQSSTQEEFISLFGSEVLDLLPRDGLWDRMMILEAAPGAGKSTILRLFSPEVLMEVYRNRTRTENLDLFSRLEDLGALSQSGPNILGTLVSCRGQYAAIDDLSLTMPEKIRWFFGLLDARVTLLTLKDLCVFAELEFPKELSRISIFPNASATDTARTIDNGLRLFDEAARREDSLVSAIDSLTNRNIDEESLRTELRYLRTLSSCRFELENVRLPTVYLTMFDDVQDLTPWQQRALIKDLENRDVRTGRWIARRLDVLSIDELLQSGGKSGRDYERRRIEDWARTNRVGFNKLLKSIADRRIRKADLAITRFESLLDAQMARPSEIRSAKQTAIDERQAVLNGLGNQSPFAGWIERTEEETDKSSKHMQVASSWRALEILTNRRRNRKGQSPINSPRSVEELLQQRNGAVTTAAELLVAIDHNLPFYYGLKRLSDLASANVEQFLRIGSALFDKHSMLRITGRRNNISSTEQDSIVRQLAKSTFAELPVYVSHGQDVQKLVHSIGTFAREVTTREAASYAPGILGVGLKKSQFDALLNQQTLEERPELGRLREVLKACIAHNVLEPRGPMKVKGDLWMVFYLNRLLSPAFDLPVVSSQFQGVDLSELVFWLAHGYRSPSHQERLIQ